MHNFTRPFICNSNAYYFTSLPSTPCQFENVRPKFNQFFDPPVHPIPPSPLTSTAPLPVHPFITSRLSSSWTLSSSPKTQRQVACRHAAAGVPLDLLIIAVRVSLPSLAEPTRRGLPFHSDPAWLLPSRLARNYRSDITDIPIA